MLKTSILIVGLSVVSLAQNSNLENITDLKTFVGSQIDAQEMNKTSDWTITHRTKRSDGESFISTLLIPDHETNSRAKEDNKTQIVAPIVHEDRAYGKFDKLSFSNDINYTKDDIAVRSTLVELQLDKDATKKNKKIIKKIIDDKLIVVNGHYSLKDHLYSATLKDIDTTVDDLKMASRGLIIDGYYDPKERLKNKSHLAIENISIMPTLAKFAGDYLKIERFEATSDITSDDKTMDMNYNMKLGLLDINASGKHSNVEDFNLEIKIVNIDIPLYKELEDFTAKHANPTPKDMDKIQALTTKLLTSGDISIEIKDLSVKNLIEDGKNLGASQISLKVSLKGGKDLGKSIALNPMMALSALDVDGKFIFSTKTMKMIFKSKKAGLLMLLPTKQEGDNFIYDVQYKKGKLTINGKKM